MPTDQNDYAEYTFDLRQAAETHTKTNDVIDFYLPNIIDGNHEKQHPTPNETVIAQLCGSLVSNGQDDNLCDRLVHKLEQTHASNYLSALLVIRLTNYRSLKENFGSRLCFELITLMQLRLAEHLRLDDLIEQITEDEFNIVLDSIANKEQLESVAKRLNDNCSGMYILENQRLHIQTTVGIALYPSDAEIPEQLLRFARIALNQSDSQNVYHQFFSKAQFEKQQNHFWIESELEQAVEEGRMIIHYQPQYEINDQQKIIGMEALIRMIDGNGKLIPPDQFISLAENNGMIVSIGHWVIHQASHQLKRWHNEGHTELRVSVNVSPRQMNDDHLITVVDQAIAESGLKYSDLELEITEQCILEHLSTIEKVLSNLSRKGVRISLDDFGTGYSSLAYLSHFPLSLMKLDRIFLENVPDDPKACRIVTAIIEMAKKLGLEVIAEGIEQDDQNRFLESLGCHIGQGFGFSRPIPANEITDFLENHTYKSQTVDTNNPESVETNDKE